jgi:hypothetical protein
MRAYDEIALAAEPRVCSNQVPVPTKIKRIAPSSTAPKESNRTYSQTPLQKGSSPKAFLQGDGRRLPDKDSPLYQLCRKCTSVNLPNTTMDT